MRRALRDMSGGASGTMDAPVAWSVMVKDAEVKMASSKGVSHFSSVSEVFGWRFVTVARRVGGDDDTWLRLRVRSDCSGCGSM